MIFAITCLFQVMLGPSGSRDYTGAALLLDQMAHKLLPAMHLVSGPNICTNLASFAKCRYSPSAEFLLAALQELQVDGAQKMVNSQLPALAALMVALNRLIQAEGNWPVLQAVLQQTTIKLQQQLAQQQQQKVAQQRFQQHMQQLYEGPPPEQGSEVEQPAATAAAGTQDQGPQQLQPQLDGTAATAAAGNDGCLTSDSGAVAAARQQQASAARLGKVAGSVALLAFHLDRYHLLSPAYLSALHSWAADPQNVDQLPPNGLLQLWSALRGQYTRGNSSHGGLQDEGAESNFSHSGSSSADAGELELPAAGGGGTSAQPAAAAVAELDNHQHNLQEQQQSLKRFFGPHTLDTLAAATAKKLPEMTEREIGQLLSFVAGLRYSSPPLMAALEAAVERVLQVQQLTPTTAMAAAWAAMQLQQPRTQLLQPAFLAAVTDPDGFSGVMSGRLLRVTSALPSDFVQDQVQKLREEQHKLSGSRGSAPEASVGNAPWVDSIAESVSDRLLDFKPREIAHVLHCFSSIPGVQLHDKLFGAAAKHIGEEEWLQQQRQHEQRTPQGAVDCPGPLGCFVHSFVISRGGSCCCLSSMGCIISQAAGREGHVGKEFPVQPGAVPAGPLACRRVADAVRCNQGRSCTNDLGRLLGAGRRVLTLPMLIFVQASLHTHTYIHTYIHTMQCKQC
jgi:hypothetical protein